MIENQDSESEQDDDMLVSSKATIATLLSKGGVNIQKKKYHFVAWDCMFNLANADDKARC